MKSARRGKRTSKPEVTNVSPHGIWLLLDDREHFVAFADFPWFENAPLQAIFDVELAGPGHLHWPRLDVDLAVASLDRPQDFPLVSRVREATPTYAPTKPARRRRRSE
jgi:hypothetical protein